MANGQEITKTGVAVAAGSGLLAGVIAGPIAKTALPFSESSSFLDPALSRTLNNFTNAALNTTEAAVERNVMGNVAANLDYPALINQATQPRQGGEATPNNGDARLKSSSQSCVNRDCR